MKSEPLLLDRTSADPSSLAIKISNFPIVMLLNFVRICCTGTSAVTWGPLALVKQLGKTVNFYQNPR